jgi:uncharacterized phage-associated protein
MLPSHTYVRSMICAGNNVIGKLTRAVYKKSRRKDGISVFGRNSRESDEQERRKTVLLSQEVKMPVSPIATANEFIALSQPNGVTHMKLQKLVYLTLEEWLKNHNETFLSRGPEVWQYGPVFPDLYHELKFHRSQAITDLQAMYDVAERVESPDIKACIEKVWQKYRTASATYLSDLTHRAGSPWHQIAQRCNFSVPFGTEIPVNDIKKYVREQAQALA